MTASTVHPLLVKHKKKQSLELKPTSGKDISFLPAVRFGIRSEPVVKRMLEEQMPSQHTDFKLTSVGLVCSKEHVKAVCSPDFLWR